jgi:hypothetical protein
MVIWLHRQDWACVMRQCHYLPPHIMVTPPRLGLWNVAVASYLHLMQLLGHKPPGLSILKVGNGVSFMPDVTYTNMTPSSEFRYRYHIG